MVSCFPEPQAGLQILPHWKLSCGETFSSSALLTGSWLYLLLLQKHCWLPAESWTERSFEVRGMLVPASSPVFSARVAGHPPGCWI